MSPHKLTRLLDALIAGFLAAQGATTRAQRAALMEIGEGQDLATVAPAPGISAGLEHHAARVARWAYKVTEEDFQALEDQGHSQDAVLEATLAGGLGVSTSRLRRALALLETP